MPLRIFLSGGFATGTKEEKDFLKRSDCKHRCFTFANLDKLNKHYSDNVEAALAVCEKQGVSIMLDSGAASLHNMQAATKKRGRIAEAKQVDTTKLAEDLYARYVKYCKANKEKWTFYVTLDFKKHQPTIMAMQEKFEADGLRPIPVFHGDASVDWINRYADKGYSLMGLGNNPAARSRGNYKNYRYYLDEVFNRCIKLNMNLHGLAMTSLTLMLDYPWWSVDSATWTKAAAYGYITLPDYSRGVINNVHVSARHSKHPTSYNRMNPQHKTHLEGLLKDYGFDLHAMRESVHERQIFNAWLFSHLGAVGLDLNAKKARQQWEKLL